jgi:hypothetical protein
MAPMTSMRWRHHRRSAIFAAMDARTGLGHRRILRDASIVEPSVGFLATDRADA